MPGGHPHSDGRPEPSVGPEGPAGVSSPPSDDMLVIIDATRLSDATIGTQPACLEHPGCRIVTGRHRRGTVPMVDWNREVQSTVQRRERTSLGPNEAKLRHFCPTCHQPGTVWLWLERVQQDEGRPRQLTVSGILTDFIHESNEAAGRCGTSL